MHIIIKSNQKYTSQEIKSYFYPLYKKHIQKTETTELSHGRIETGYYEMIPSSLTLELMRFCFVGVICSPL